MKTLLQVCIAALLASSCAAISAAPAAWFKYRSKIDGQQVCAQTPLGHGWEIASGPYRDSHCTKFITAK